MKRYIVLSLILLISLVCTAQEIEYQVDKPQLVYIGTPIDIYVKLTMAPADSVYSTVADSLDIFLLQGEVFQTEEILAGEKIINLKLTYQPFHTGEYTFPQLEYAVKTPSGMQILTTSEFQVNVKSALPDSAQVIKDIAEPVTVSLTFWDYALPILGLILLVLLIKYLRKYLKREKGTEFSKTVPEDTRPAWLIALEQLENLKKSDLLDQGDFINYHFQLSLILRNFLELRYNIKAVEMTTSEIRSQLVMTDHKEKSALLEYLTNADRIKFAKYPTDRAKSYQATDWLEKYFISYKEKAETVEEVKANV